MFSGRQNSDSLFKLLALLMAQGDEECWALQLSRSGLIQPGSVALFVLTCHLSHARFGPFILTSLRMQIGWCPGIRT